MNISDRPAFTPDMYFLIFIDADNNPSTGDTNALGSEYAVDWSRVRSACAGNGTTYAAASSQTSLTYPYAEHRPDDPREFSRTREDEGVRFGTLAASGFAVDANGNPDTTNEHDDLAPDPTTAFTRIRC